jgi:hypothetical protein
MALMENPYPTSRLCFSSNGGFKNVTFCGVGGRNARTENLRQYYIEKIPFFKIYGTQIFDNFDPPTPIAKISQKMGLKMMLINWVEN